MNQMPAPPPVTEALDSGVLTLTLGGGVAHPLSRGMIGALHDALRRAGDNDAVRAIILHGPGHIFCAGHDLKEIARHRDDPDLGRAYLEDVFRACAAMMLDLTMSPKATIAVVEGIATAAGLQLAAACDVAFASERATFCLPGVQNGGFCTTPSVTVARSIGRKRVLEMALSGAAFDARWALEAGLVNRVLPDGEAMAAAREFARGVARYPQAAVGIGKQTLYRHMEMPLAEAYALATPVMVEHFMDPARLERERNG